MRPMNEAKDAKMAMKIKLEENKSSQNLSFRKSLDDLCCRKRPRTLPIGKIKTRNMKFTVQGKEFLNKLNSTAKVLNAKNTISMLDNFLLSLEEGTLTIVGSDTENVMTSRLEVFDPEGSGKVAVPAKRLIEIVKEISDQPVEFEVHDDFRIEVSYLNGDFNLMGVDPSAWPAVPALEDGAVEITVPAGVVAKGLANTLYAVATESIRPVMTGVYWDIFEDKMVFVSSDTHKLVRYTNKSFKPGQRLDFILHSKTSGIINSLLTSADNDVTIRLDSKSATFSFGSFELRCRFLKGKFPNYDRVIPNDNPYEIIVDRQSLLSGVRRVAIFASKSSGLVRFGVGEGAIQLSTQDLDYSVNAKEKVACNYNGRPCTLGFKSEYTIEILNNIAGDSVSIKFSDPARPTLFLPLEQQENEELVVLQMPLQVID